MAIPGAPPAVPFAVNVAMPPSLRALYGSSTSIPTSASETVDDVKAAVQAITGMSAAEQALVFGSTPLMTGSQALGAAGIANGDTLTLGRPLTDDSATLGSVGVPNRGAMDLTVPAAAAAQPPPYIVRVDLPASLQPTYGSRLTIPTSASASVGDLKSRIAGVTGMSASEQQLAFGSLPLTSDTQTLGGAGMVSGDVVTLSSPTPSVTVNLPAELHSTFGPSVTVAAGPTDTVADVKAAVEAQTGVPVANQTLAYAPPPATYITVGLPASMHATHGPTITLAVDPATETVADVKARVLAQTGVSPSDQTLSFGGSPLSNDASTLGSYGVPSGGQVTV